MGFIAFIVAGQQIFQAIQQPLPAFYHRVAENKWQWGMGVWFIGNQVSNTLISTGAFEIYVNDRLEYSKLASGQMPEGHIVAQILKKYGITA